MSQSVRFLNLDGGGLITIGLATGVSAEEIRQCDETVSVRNNHSCGVW